MSRCDKCGHDVPRNNDAIQLEVILSRMKTHGTSYRDEDCADTAAGFITLTSARHLLPVRDGKTEICPGSPSRAQYLEGQPRDPRDTGYDSKLEALYRAAHRRLIESTKK